MPRNSSIVIRTAGVAISRLFIVQPNSGSVPLRASRMMPSVQSNPFSGFRNGAKNASRAWYGIAATGVFPVRELGVCQSRLFIVRIARSQSSMTLPSRTLQICSVQKVQMHGGQRMSRTSLTRPLPVNAAARNLPKNMTSWMFGLIAAFLTLRLWNSMIACVGRLTCIWKVLTSIVAGSSHPC